MKANEIRPRDAASLVLLRDTPDGLEVLLGRRPDSARFMPGVYVFPGGAIDPSDAEQSQAVGVSVLAWTALRETWEETGILHGRAMDQPRESAPECPCADAYRAAGLAPDSTGIHYIARAITPPFRPIRFDTRFFLAEGALASGTLRASDELADVAWVAVRDALASDRVREVTKFVLTEAVDLHGSRKRLTMPDRTIPHMHFQDGVRTVHRETQAEGLSLHPA